MKAIKIIKKNRKKIEKAIDFEQKIRTTKILTFDEIVKAMNFVQAKLNNLLSKKDQIGIIIIIDVNAEDFPGKYKESSMSTKFQITFRSSGWFVTEISRGYCNDLNNKYFPILTNKQKRKVVNFIEQYKNW